jgi:transcriptional regulator with XRE-family HTH domain
VSTIKTIRDLRIKAGVSQSEVAKRWGMSQALLTLIELEHRNASPDELIAIKKATAAAIRDKATHLAEIAESISA